MRDLFSIQSFLDDGQIGLIQVGPWRAGLNHSLQALAPYFHDNRPQVFASLHVIRDGVFVGFFDYW
jgi:hypothetical protein